MVGLGFDLGQILALGISVIFPICLWGSSHPPWDLLGRQNSIWARIWYTVGALPKPVGPSSST